MVDKKDLVYHIMRPTGIRGLYETDIKLAKASPEGKHRRYWCGSQQSDELTILKFFDSESEKPGSKLLGVFLTVASTGSESMICHQEKATKLDSLHFGGLGIQ
jgi:hypothetical protein